MQKRSFLTVICFLLITNAFAHELDDISLSEEPTETIETIETPESEPNPEDLDEFEDLIPSEFHTIDYKESFGAQFEKDMEYQKNLAEYLAFDQLEES